MTTQAGVLGERVTHIEAAMEHLATKSDLAALHSAMHQMETRLTRWTVGTMLGGMAAAAAIAAAVAALTGKERYREAMMVLTAVARHLRSAALRRPESERGRADASRCLLADCRQ